MPLPQHGGKRGEGVEPLDEEGVAQQPSFERRRGRSVEEHPDRVEPAAQGRVGPVTGAVEQCGVGRGRPGAKPPRGGPTWGAEEAGEEGGEAGHRTPPAPVARAGPAQM